MNFFALRWVLGYRHVAAGSQQLGIHVAGEVLYVVLNSELFPNQFWDVQNGFVAKSHVAFSFSRQYSLNSNFAIKL